MKKPLKEFEFVLENGVQYSYQGDNLTTFKLTLKAPGSVHSKFCNKLTKSFFSSAQKMKNDFQGQATSPADEQSTAELDGNSIVMAMLVGDDMDSIHECFREFMCFRAGQNGSVCLLDGKEQMKEAVFDRLTLSDMNRLLGEYVKNFLIPSLA